MACSGWNEIIEKSINKRIDLRILIIIIIIIIITIDEYEKNLEFLKCQTNKLLL